MDAVQTFNLAMSTMLIAGSLLAIFLRVAYADRIAQHEPALLALIAIFLVSVVTLITASGVTHQGEMFRYAAAITRGMALTAVFTLDVMYINVLRRYPGGV